MGHPAMEVEAGLDELLPVKKHLAPSWGDSLSIRGIRSYIATHTYFSSTPREYELHDCEITMKTPRPDPKCRLLVYVPSAASALEPVTQPKGVLVHFHGGGWSICTAEMEGRLCRYLANTLGCIVIAPDYAKAPEYYFPHALRQAYTVLRYIATPLYGDSKSPCFARDLNEKLPTAKQRLAFDRTKIAVTGGSSGGNIAAALTLLVDRLGLPENTKIVAAGLQYPGLNLSTAYEEKLASLEDQSQILPPPWASKLFLRCFLPAPYDACEARKNPFISPGLAPDDQLRRFPPTQIVTAQYDHYRVESEAFAKRLSALDIPCQIDSMPGVAHAFDTANMGDEARKARNEEARKQSWLLLADHLKQYI